MNAQVASLAYEAASGRAYVGVANGPKSCTVTIVMYDRPSFDMIDAEEKATADNFYKIVKHEDIFIVFQFWPGRPDPRAPMSAEG